MTTITDPDEINTSEIARRFGVSEVTVSAKLRPLAIKIRRGVYPRETIEMIGDDVFGIAARRSAKDSENRAALTGLPSKHHGGAERARINSADKLASARADLEAAKAEKARVLVEREMGRLVEREAVSELAVELATRVRVALLSVPSRVGTKVIGCTDAAEAAAIVEEAIRDALEQLRQLEEVADAQAA